MSSSFTGARAHVARLTQLLDAGHPDLVAARLRMREEFVVGKIAEILDKGPELTPNLRSRIDAVLSARETAAP